MPVADNIIPVKTSLGAYDIILERGAISNVKEYLNLDRKVLVVTDSGVPKEYSQAIASSSKAPYIVTLEQGETSKNINNYTLLISKLVEYGFTRSDCVVAVGGGVIGDLSGFAAGTYMRGIDFYNVPTTLLSQVDSSVGGKTAIDFMGIKNNVGAFYPPKRVIIDPETLKTLPNRQISNGLAEALKMALTHDAELFELFEQGSVNENIDIIIKRSLLIKKSVVESDEREGGLRRVLNFGHTLAHAIESENEMKNLYHGEAVAIGMIPMCDEKVRARLIKVLLKLNLPCEISTVDAERIIKACRNDKKLQGDEITLVYVPEVGSFDFLKMPFSQYERMLREVI
ncbi:MAG: 3-dehydroquinate synthase [Clostridia bacterium]|nr:3-dehydroquinate synthase [Clostridia bacterium]